MPPSTRLAAVWGLALLAAPAAGQTTYIWNQPATGTTGNWSTATWSPGVPVSGAANVLRFNGLPVGTGTANSFTFTNDLGAFTANGLILNNSTVNNLATTGATLTLALGANALTLDGTSPFLQAVGQANVAVTGTAGIDLAAATTVTGAGGGFLNLNTPVTGAGGLTVSRTGFGITSLTGANTFAGGVTLNGGFLQLGSTNALGTGPLTVAGGALRFSTTGILGNAITANGPLVIAGGTGALTATSVPTLTGVISGAGGVEVRSYNTAAGATLQGANTTTGPVLLRAAFPNTNTLAGGTLTLSGADGALAAAGSYTLERNTLLAVGGGTANANRISDAAPIRVTNATVSYLPVTGGTDETFGNVTATGTFALATTAVGLSRMNFGTLTRVDNATVQLNSNSFGTINSATVATLPTFTGGVSAASNVTAGAETQIGILPWAVASSQTNPRSLVTYDAANGLTAIPHTNATFIDQVTQANFAAALAGGTLTNRNVHFNGAGAYNLNGGTLRINALTTTGSTQTYSNGTLEVASGMTVNFDSVLWDGATLRYPAGVTGYIHQSWNQVFTGTSQIVGDSGLVVSGGAGTAVAGTTRTLTFQNAGNPFTGGLFVNGGAGVGFRADNQLGAAGGAVTLSGGALVYNAAADLTVNRPVKLNGSGVVNFNVVGGGGTAGNATATTALTLGGVVSGDGALIKDGLGVLALAGTNTYGGGTVVNAGTLRFAADANLGSAAGRLTLNGGTLHNTAAVTTARAVDVNASSTLLTDAALTLGGPLANIGTVYGATPLPVLTKAGTGVLSLTGDARLMTGNVVVAAGGLTLGGGATAGGLTQVPNLTVTTNSVLTLDNGTAYNPDRLGDFTRVVLTGPGAAVRYLPPAAAVVGTAETIGTLDAAAGGGVLSLTAGNGPVQVRIGNLVAANAVTIRGDDLGGDTGNYTRVLLDALNGTPVTAPFTVIPNVFFAATAGTTASTQPAGYDLTRGVIAFTPTPVGGTSLNNAAPDNVPLTAAYTTSGNATATTGVSVFSLTLDGGTTLTLNSGQAAGGVNGNTPEGTLAISGGQLTSQNGAKGIVAGTAATPVVQFGAAAATVTTTSDLTLSTGVTLAGTGGLTKLGTGTLTINGVYNVAGTTTVSAGTLAVGTGATITTLGNLTVPTGGTATFGAALTTNALTVSGGTVNLNAAATVTTLTADAGTLNVNASSTIGSFAGTGTAGTVNIPTGQTLSVSGATPGQFNGTLTGAGSLALTGTGTTLLVLGGNNSGFTGGLTTSTAPGFATLTATGFGTGPISLTGTNAARQITVAAPTDVTVANDVSFTTGTANMAFFAPVVTNRTFTLSGRLSGTAAVVLFNGVFGSNNTFVLTNDTNDFTAPIVRVFEGYLGITSNAVLGNAANAVDLNATAPGGLRFDGANIDLARPVSVTFSTNDINTNGFNATVSGVLSGTSGLNKTGAGTLILSNVANTFTGAATVSGGTLLVNGLLPGTAGGVALTVNAGATLGGTGTLGGAATPRNVTVAAGGRLAPGASIGTLTVNGNLTVNAGTAAAPTPWQVEFAAIPLGGTANNTQVDQIVLAGDAARALTINTAGGSVVRIDLVLTSGTFTPDFTTPVSYPILVNASTGAAAGSLAGVTFQYTTTGFSAVNFQTAYVGNDLVLTFVPVPEPLTGLAVAAAGLGGLRLVRRRRVT
jgi:autotransporter-associated beta strand protein